MHSDLNEIYFVLDAYKDKREQDFKLDLTRDYSLANQIACFIGCILSGEKFPTLEELYPQHFEQKSYDELSFIKFKELADAVNNNRKVTNEFRNINN